MQIDRLRRAEARRSGTVAQLALGRRVARIIDFQDTPGVRETKMHIEVQVALNFVISYLYNKLPRRRVNIFGEELEKALKDKFRGHWYPDRPCRGSAFRCLKTGGPLDPVLERAARESGVPVRDVLEHLPRDLAVWVDPGEVSYRIGEKGAVKVLFSSDERAADERTDREVTRAFNPEAQCFRPVEPAAAPSPPAPAAFSPAPPFRAQPLTFTTATFAQTKFGSTKLKTSSKRANRMSPTEFSNYIKQRALQQQLAARALSPPAPADPAAYFLARPRDAAPPPAYPPAPAHLLLAN
ncbi:unnamed protein product [Plutella xylostella]|nr:unnamed protein product [Plutella xylostella]